MNALRGSPRRSRLSPAGLLRRQWTTAPGASIALALLVLVGAFLATAVPRAATMLHTQAVHEQLAAVPAAELDLTATARERPTTGPGTGPTTLDDDVAAAWGSTDEYLGAIVDGMPADLASVVDTPLAMLTVAPVRAVVEGAGPSAPSYRIMAGFDPRLREHVELTAGEWPAPVDAPVPSSAPVEIVLTDAVADRMEWSVGESRTIDVEGTAQPVVLAGTVAPLDPDDGIWTHIVPALEPSVVDNGLAPPEITAVAFVDPASWSDFASVSMPLTLEVWVPVDIANITADMSARLQSQVGRFSSELHAVGSGEWADEYFTVGGLSFSSGLRAELEAAAAAAAAGDAVLATVASGPIGVMIAVLLLGARVVFERRREGLELVAARGASTGQLRGILALEGLAIGVPAALVGGVGGTLAFAFDGGPVGAAVAVLFALTPAALLIVSAPSLSPLRRARADLGTSSDGRLRLLGELVVVLLAAAAVAVLFRRGLATSSSAVGVDPLLAAVPLLLSLVACIFVLRVYPIPLARIVGSLAAKPGLVGFLGSARALRDPSAGLVPVLAVVVGVSVAVFSSVLLGTIQTGVEAAASHRVGADASVAGRPMTRAQLDEMRELPGVEVIAPVYSTRSASLSIDGRQRTTTLIVIDVAEMQAVQAGRADTTPLPDSLVKPADDDGVPVLVSGVVDAVTADAAEVRIEGDPYTVESVVEGTTAYSPRANWMLMDRSNAEPYTDTLVPRTVLVRFESGAGGDGDTDEIVSALAEIAGPGTTVQTAESVADELSSTTTVRGLVAALIAAIVLTSLLTALAIVLTLVVGRPARDRLLPLLATLGLDRRGRRALVAWEIGPVTAVSLLVGATLGLVIPYLVLGGIDLSTFTGGDGQPDVAYDPWLITAVLAASVVVTAMASTLAASLGSRIDVARALRKEEEG
ncbi:putative ABC transport system permease protein [Agromyces terreus]|uniref:ABC transport system permease protein n=1 Tax=Agromyces terreus TaxID=424795 RepID=A0A9X2H4T5_9MICO|nr:ABC transporter permease [Agromyces terreus]MCP2369419.1 putative ABC transport system permease protein [Agromyces terreus]